MWPIIMNFVRIYAPYIVWPAAAVIGVVGYNFEKIVRGDKTTPWSDSTADQRGERMLKEIEDTDVTHVDKLKDKTFVPRTIFGKNDFDKKSS